MMNQLLWAAQEGGTQMWSMWKSRGYPPFKGFMTHISNNILPKMTFRQFWDSLDKESDGELTLAMANSGKNLEFFQQLQFIDEDKYVFFKLADNDQSGGVSKEELTDYIHMCIEGQIVPEFAVPFNTDKMMC